ncbi:MAG: hypothetical protein U0R26_04160 [Solirubrobacterales bacterium]
MRRILEPAALLIACALATLIGGCGGDGGFSSGATVSVYASAHLCAGARRELAQEEGRAGSVRIRVVCLASERNGGRLSLATIGANARRATEDSTAMAYIEGPSSDAARFSRPLVESAGIAWISGSSGETAMGQVLGAIAEADSSSVRDSVREALNKP